MVGGTSCSQEDMVVPNKFKQVRTPSIDKKNDLSIAKPGGFVHEATNSQRDLNAIGTLAAFHSYSLFLIRKTPFS